MPSVYVSVGRPASVRHPLAFGECEINALSDLFHQFATTADGDAEDDAGDEDAGSAPYLCEGQIRLLLESIGERPSDDYFQEHTYSQWMLLQCTLILTQTT